MTSLLEIAPAIEADPYEPSLEDDTWLVGYETARDGEAARLPGFGWSPEARLRFARGTMAGADARRLIEARELGRAQGFDGAVTEPPPGYSGAEAAAWRDGQQEGEAASGEFAAWCDEMFAETPEDWALGEMVEARGHRAYA